MSYKLEYPYTEEQRANFIVEYNHQKGLNIETIDNFVEVDVEIKDEENKTLTKKEIVNYPTHFALEPWEILQDGVVVDNTENYNKELIEREKERIGSLKCTKRVFALMLQEVGIDYLTMLKPLIESNPQAQLEWDLCIELERKNPLLDIMAIQMGITPEHLDLIFKYANGELTDEQFLEMVAKIVTPEKNEQTDTTEPTEAVE